MMENTDVGALGREERIVAPVASKTVCRGRPVGNEASMGGSAWDRAEKGATSLYNR